MATDPTAEQLTAIVHTLAQALRHNMELFAVFAHTSQTAAHDIETVLDLLATLDKPTDPGDLFETIRGHVTAHATITGQTPQSIAVATATRDRLDQAARDKIGRDVSPQPDHLLGLPLVVDDTLPADPGFEIHPRRPEWDRNHDGVDLDYLSPPDTDAD